MDEHDKLWLKNLSAYREGCTDCEEVRWGTRLCEKHAEIVHRSAPCASCGTRVVYADRSHMIVATNQEVLCSSCQVQLLPAYAHWKATGER